MRGLATFQMGISPQHTNLVTWPLVRLARQVVHAVISATQSVQAQAIVTEAHTIFLAVAALTKVGLRRIVLKSVSELGKLCLA